MKRFLTILLLLALLLCSCTSGGEEQTTEGETTAAAATEPAETEPEETAAAHEAKKADGFRFSMTPAETVTEASGEVDVSLRNSNSYTVAFESRFYGPQSMVDRDSHHMGDIYVAAVYAKEYPQDTGYFYGEFTGDRFSDYMTYNGGELRIYKGKGTYARYNDSKLLYTQQIDTDGDFRGAGDFNGDRFTDLLFVTNKKSALIGYGSEDGFTFASAGVLPDSGDFSKEDFQTGDMDGDGVDDIIAVKSFDTSSWTIKDGKAALYAKKQLNIKDEYNCFCIADINTDGFCDLIVAIDGLGLRTYFGRVDGQFGPYENEIGNVNLYPTWESNLPIKYMTRGDTNEDGVDDIVATTKIKANKDFGIYSLTYPTVAPAYDYSTHIIKKTDGTYILYNGGLYVDYNKDKYNPTDGDHVLVYTSDDGRRWHRNLEAPAFYLGGELGVSNEWWSGNTIEPEVVYVDGTYYMYWQCENYTHLEDGTLIGHDKIGVATSTDGLHFERKTDRPVIINEPEYSAFDHEEVIYVKDDPDGLPYWMFVRHVVRNVTARIIRLRTADPFCFDFATAEEVSGWEAFGNQTGYVNLDDGSRLFVRINFIQRSSAVPTLQFSEDGLNWIGARVALASVSLSDPKTVLNPNCYFLGFSTLNGTGEIEKLPDGRYRFFYGACTSQSPVAPMIFYSSVGGGECIFSIE